MIYVFSFESIEMFNDALVDSFSQAYDKVAEIQVVDEFQVRQESGFIPYIEHLMNWFPFLDSVCVVLISLQGLEVWENASILP